MVELGILDLSLIAGRDGKPGVKRRWLKGVFCDGLALFLAKWPAVRRRAALIVGLSEFCVD